MAADLGRLGHLAVRTSGLTRGYGGRAVLDGVDLRIAAGEFVALLGRSGSGKSTLLRALAGLDAGVAGSGELQVPGGSSSGATDSGHGSGVAVVFQDSRLLPWARVLDNVILGLGGADGRGRGRAALAEVGLADRERAWPSELSGGEQQRVALARSLVRQPELLLADEPFGALDALTRIRMHELLRELCQRHRPAVLLVTHDVDEAVLLADRVLVLERGRIVMDRQIDLDQPRAHRDPAFLTHRETLLAALGVGQRTEREAVS
ncbi:MAG TPA: ABC transporter ATP-binding protein [Pseudonocardia sp.]|uniref:ABC transporter ATP-binding protein n=1 Tax=Pseudonocardia sp. TaxID=60912 RepID=UPI002CF4A37B|nr:ABC transporter ATP-binding protein [Pseudonocardia sp.]HTF51104.1 ABC transporter ATP-binding protein [Pseudonocardia sp.]